MQMEIAGTRVTYKDIPELRQKLGELLDTRRTQRAQHDEAARSLRGQERSIEKILGIDRSSQEAKEIQS
jgi:hypothetical protein